MSHNILLLIVLICAIFAIPLLFLGYKLFGHYIVKRAKGLRRNSTEPQPARAMHAKAVSVNAISYPTSEGKTNSAREIKAQPGSPPHKNRRPSSQQTTFQEHLPGQIGTPHKLERKQSSSSILYGSGKLGVPRKDSRKMSTSMNVEQELMGLGPPPQDNSELEAEYEERRRKLLQMP